LRVSPFGWLNRLIVWGMDFSEGPAILSRFPIVAHEVYDLPRCRKRLDPRVLLRAEVDAAWGRLHVFSTHIARDDCQIEAVAERVRAFQGPLPAIVTGDFNMGEHLPAMVSLVNGHGFVDAFRRANPGARGATVWQRIHAAQSTASRRVDYVLYLPGTRVAGRLVSSQVILDEPGRLADGSRLWPSDHYGVMAAIDLREPVARVQ
jgi:endonuclease/exonuclease/phosphatase family metal-dependent hydrolase